MSETPQTGRDDVSDLALMMAVPEVFDEFQQGYNAFHRGESDCPFPAQGNNPKRYLWWRGYLNGRASHLL